MPDYDNEDIVSQTGPYIPFTRPVFPPITLPRINDAPLVCLTINDEWMSYVIGCVQALARYETWKTDRATAADLVEQAHSIPRYISTDCVPAPTHQNWFWFGSASGDGTVIHNPPNVDGITYGNIALSFGDLASLDLRGITWDEANNCGGPYAAEFHTDDGLPAVWTWNWYDCFRGSHSGSDYTADLYFRDGLVGSEFGINCLSPFNFSIVATGEYECIVL